MITRLVLPLAMLAACSNVLIDTHKVEGDGNSLHNGDHLGDDANTGDDVNIGDGDQGGDLQGGGCPGWTSQDIGLVGIAGSLVCHNGTFTMTGSGEDIWDTSDEFRFTYQQMDGDLSIVARVVSHESTYEWSKAGVMIRETLAGNSAHVHMLLSSGAANPTKFDGRLSTGATTGGNSGTVLAAPYWVKIERYGDTFQGFESADGSSWTLVGTHTVSMSNSIYVGLSLTSNENTALATAAFDNVTVTVNPLFQDGAPQDGAAQDGAPQDGGDPHPGDTGGDPGNLQRPVVNLDELKAFPTAEGHGRYASGGRGGTLYKVTNLNTSGPGSLAYGLNNVSGPRTIVFDVSGTITYSGEAYVGSWYGMDPDITVAGQSAPGKGLCIKGAQVSQHTNNGIWRHLRIRHDSSTYAGNSVKCFRIRFNQPHDIILDHLSMSYALDENLSLGYGVPTGTDARDVYNITVQNCLISDNNGSGGGIFGPGVQDFTLYNTVYAWNEYRNPAVSHGFISVEIVNNYFYGMNYRWNAFFDSEYDIAGNVWANETVAVRPYVFEANPSAYDPSNSLYYYTNPANNQLYFVDNLVEGVTFNAGQVTPAAYDPRYDAGTVSTTTPFVSSGISDIKAASELKAHMVPYVGAGNGTAQGLDSYDTQILSDIANGVQSNFKQRGQEVYPDLGTEARPANYDSIVTGIPDTFSSAHEISTANGVKALWEFADYDVVNTAGYTNIEIYLAFIAGDFERLLEQ